MREVLLILLALAALCFALWQRVKTRRTLRRLEEMLSQAISGTFAARRFDESQLSATEARFAQYLSASAISARRVREEEDAVKALIGDISHQVRTPLANIRLYTQLLAEQPLNERGRTCVGALDAQAEKLQALLEALVKTSRLETGVLALHPEPAPLSPVILRAVEQYRSKAETKQITLTAEPTDGLTAVFDAKWTEEALCNLLDNADKHGGSGGRVDVSVVREEDDAVIRIRDYGPGIPEEELPHVKYKFYKGSSKARGSGIGLAVCEEIITRHGGTLELSNAEGGGCLVAVRLPLDVE